VLLAVLVLAVTVGGLTRLRVDTGLGSFLPSGDPAATQFEELSREFGGDPVVVLVETDQPRAMLRGDRLETLVRMEGALARLPDVATVYGPGTLLNQIAGRTQDLLAELSGRRDAERVRAESAARGRGVSPTTATTEADRAAAAFDERYATLLAQGLPAGLPTLKNPSFVDTVVFGGAGAPRSQWRFVVPSETSVAVLVRPREALDAAAAAGLVDGVRAAIDGADLGPGARTTVSGVPAVVASLSDRTTATAPVLGAVAVAAVAGCFLLVRWTRRRDRVLPVVTTVAAIAMTLAAYGWIGRPVSLGVVAFLSVVLGIGCYYPTYVLLGASRRTVLTVACATALSFATLTLSPLPLVRDLGITLASGVVLAALVGLAAPAITGRSTSAPEAKPQPSTRTSSWRSPWAVGGLAAVILAAGVGWAALPSIPLRTDVDQFAAGLPVVQEARHVEDVMGSSGELDVVLRGPDTMSSEALAWQRQALETTVTRHGDALRPVVSPPALMPFLGPEATDDQILSALRLLPSYLTGAVLSPDRATAVLSFGVRLEDLDRLTAARDDLVAALPPPPAGYVTEVTGLPIVAMRGSELVAEDRVLANVVGIVAAGTVLAIGLRRRTDALVAVASAILATGTGLFLVWATGTALSPLTVSLGSLTAAVGCEFAVVLAEARRRGRSRLRKAVPLVTAASVLGYAALLFADLQVVRQFGLQLAVAVLLSLLCSSLVLRATGARPRPPEESPATTAPRAPQTDRNRQSVSGVC
jgi:predicted RND superfamily exporter protein